jgi:hypothetical protein
MGFQAIMGIIHATNITSSTLKPKVSYEYPFGIFLKLAVDAGIVGETARIKIDQLSLFRAALSCHQARIFF